MKLTEYVAQDATGLAQLIRRGAVSATEVATAAREAIETVNPHLNAIVDVLFDTPLDYNTDGPFAGVPFAIKDLGVHAANVPLGMGSASLVAYGCPTTPSS